MGAGGEARQVQHDQDPAIHGAEIGGSRGLAVQPGQHGHGLGPGLGGAR